MFNICLFGPPGCGKGTQAAKIIEKYKLIHLSTGDIFREEIKNKTELGLTLKSYIDKGALVPDSVVLRELYKRAIEHMDSKGLVFDGFPRTLLQADMLTRLLYKRRIPISLVISIDANEKELFKRLLKRAQEQGRSDDNELVINNRIEVYKNQTFPLLNYYEKQGKLHRVEGMNSIEKVFEDIESIISKYIKG